MRTTIVALVGAGCVAAAGAGAYLGVRSGSATSFAAPASATQAALGTGTDVEARPATEALVPATRSLTQPPTVPGPTSVASRPSVAMTKPADDAAAPATTQSTDDSLADSKTESAPGAPSDDLVAAAPQPAGAPSVDRPREPDFEELIVPADAVVGIRLDNAVSSESARLEDRVTARVVRDVTVGGRTAIRSGSKLEGTVTLVARGGRFKERARVGVRFTTLILADNTKLPIQTEAIFRDGDAPGGEATSKIGSATVIGTILGTVIGGKKGAAIGGVAGVAGGTAAVASGDRNAAIIPADASLTLRLTAPATVVVVHESEAR